MALAVGLRFYRLAVRRRGTDRELQIGPGEAPEDMFAFFEGFIARRSVTTTNDDVKRSWALELAEGDQPRTLDGHIDYGTLGYESNLRDAQSRKINYRRKASDLEEIKLYFQIWLPENCNFGLMAFQTFGGKSCITLVRDGVLEDFRSRFPGYVLEILPIAPSRTMMDAAPVKSLTFYGSNPVPDRAEGLTSAGVGLNFELTVKSIQRGNYIGFYRDVRNEFGRRTDGVVQFNGQEYDGVTAMIDFGGRKRSVGVFGLGHEPGLIDVSDDIDRQVSGQPTLESMRVQSKQLMTSFYTSLRS